jgi:hypothetical protein
MKLQYDTKQFMKDMSNVVNYSIGFLEGVKTGKTAMLENVGSLTIESMKQFIDSMARVDNEMLHHVYEWNQTGSPDARLYDLTYTVSNLGLSIRSSFRQSSSIQSGSRVPFYDKARIMENGIPVTIRPVRAKVLAFEDGGEQVFTKGPVTVSNPGGQRVQGGFEKAFDVFMNQYFSQAFLSSSGILGYLQNPVAYKKNLPAGKRFGKSSGYATGYRWIANAGVKI